MSPNIRPTTPHKTLGGSGGLLPLPPSPNRTTSQVSIISVGAIKNKKRGMLSSTSTSPMGHADEAGIAVEGHGSGLHDGRARKERGGSRSHSSSSSSSSLSSRSRSSSGSRASMGGPSSTRNALLATEKRSDTSRMNQSVSIATDGEDESTSSGSRTASVYSVKREENGKGKGREVDIEGTGQMKEGDRDMGVIIGHEGVELVDGHGEGHQCPDDEYSSRNVDGDMGIDEGEQEQEVSNLDPPDPTLNDTRSERRYYVLTDAGKPVFSSGGSEEDIVNLMGVVQALISNYQQKDDKLQCIRAGKNQILFFLRPPLYFYAVSDHGEPSHVLKSHLEYIYLQIISIVTSSQLSKVFQRRSNFDLSRLLEGSEALLKNIIQDNQYDMSYLTSTLSPSRMNPALRETAAAALMPPAKFKDLLYVLLIAGGHIVTLLRPRKHSIHPSDLHLLLNTLSSPALRQSETWLPICLPKFNAGGFVHAYISYVMDDVGLVFVSADREGFEELRGWKGIVLEKLEKDNTLKKIYESIPTHPYSVSVLGCPGLRHFFYKSRLNIQSTSPSWEGVYKNERDRRRLMVLYGRLHEGIHNSSKRSSSLKLMYIKTEHEACLGWITKPFELYLAVSPSLSKSAVVNCANKIWQWITSEESRLFLKEAPVF